MCLYVKLVKWRDVSLTLRYYLLLYSSPLPPVGPWVVIDSEHNDNNDNNDPGGVVPFVSLTRGHT